MRKEIDNAWISADNICPHIFACNAGGCQLTEISREKCTEDYASEKCYRAIAQISENSQLLEAII